MGGSLFCAGSAWAGIHYLRRKKRQQRGRETQEDAAQLKPELHSKDYKHPRKELEADRPPVKQEFDPSMTELPANEEATKIRSELSANDVVGSEMEVSMATSSQSDRSSALASNQQYWLPPL